MLRLALVFLLVAILAFFLGFDIVGGFSFWAAKVLFFVFLLLALISFIVGAFRGRPPAV